MREHLYIVKSSEWKTIPSIQTGKLLIFAYKVDKKVKRE